MKRKPNNPRKISKREYDRLAADLDRFGDLGGIVHNETTDNLVGGNQRSSVFDILGANPQIVIAETYDPPTRTGTTARGYVLHNGEKYDYRRVRWDVAIEDEACIAANKDGGGWDWETFSGWDDEMLKARGFDADTLAGWNDDAANLREMLAAREAEAAPVDADVSVDRAEELQAKWGVVTGDVWEIPSKTARGVHRVVCGDCTDAAVVGAVMGGEKADMVFTDPPYNVASESRNYAADRSKAMADLRDAEWDRDFDITTLFPVLEQVMAKDCAVYVCTSQWLVHTIWEWMWKWSAYCSYNVWCKPNPMPSLSKRHWTWATELIAYAVRGKHISNFPADGHALNWWDIPKHKETEHPTEKPIEVPERAILFSSKPNQVVFDGFLGSGTTLVACERQGRLGRGIEIAPEYVAVTLQRLSDMGLQPVKVATANSQKTVYEQQPDS